MPFALPPSHGPGRQVLPVRQMRQIPAIADRIGGMYGEDWLQTGANLWDGGPWDEWAYGELISPLGFTPERYTWRPVLPTTDLAWQYVGDVRGDTGAGDYALLLGELAAGSGFGSGLPARYLLRRAEPGYWVAIGVADGGEFARFAPYPVISCLRLPTRELFFYVGSGNLIQTSAAGSGTGSGYWLTDIPRARTTTLLLDPRKVEPFGCFVDYACCGSGSGDTDGGGSTTPCCPNPMPATLYATFTQFGVPPATVCGPGGGPGVFTVTLTGNGSGVWSGSVEYQGTTWTVDLACGGYYWDLTLAQPACGWSQNTLSFDFSCSVIDITFPVADLVVDPAPCVCPLSRWTPVVTE